NNAKLRSFSKIKFVLFQKKANKISQKVSKINKPMIILTIGIFFFKIFSKNPKKRGPTEAICTETAINEGKFQPSGSRPTKRGSSTQAPLTLSQEEDPNKTTRQ